MKLRRFNEQGMEQFRSFLAALRQDPTIPSPVEILEDPRHAEMLEPEVELVARQFDSKYDAGGYLFEVLTPISRGDLNKDVRLWSWLSFFYFDQLCPKDGHGRRKPSKQNAPYVPLAGDHRYGLDKHFLFFPWKMRVLHGERAKAILSQPLPKDADEQRAWTGYYLNLSPAVLDAFRSLYWDDEANKIKRGALSHSKKAKGTLRRFVQLVKQLEVTFDIQGMTRREILALLPNGEFRRWLSERSESLFAEGGS